MENKIKKLAAIAGVMKFLKSEGSEYHAPKIHLAPALSSFWTSYGRQQIMANNQLIQRRGMKR